MGIWRSYPEFVQADIEILNSTDVNATNVNTTNVDTTNLDTSDLNTDYVDLKTGVALPAYLEGRLAYDEDSKALTVYNDEADISLQVGQESWTRVYNDSGSDIVNGAVVYINGASSDRPTIRLASAQEYTKSRIIGVATHTIENASFGYATRYGLVKGLNTSGCVLGDTIYLNPSTDGGMTNVQPTGGNFVVRVGVCVKVDATEGRILAVCAADEFTVETKDLNGFPNRTDTTLSFVNGTRTFTITPTGATFYYYDEGVKYIKTGAQSIVIDNTEGLHLIYYNQGTLSKKANPTLGEIDTIIRTHTTVAYIYWNATGSNENYLGDERHGIVMDANTHSYLHFTRGAQWLDGGALSNISADQDGSLNAHAQFGVTEGRMNDEDIDHGTQAYTSTSGLYIYYLLGAGATLRRSTNAGFSILTAGTGRMAYNQFTGGAWQLTEVTNNKFALIHIFMINASETGKKVISILGQAEYNSVSDARAGSKTELTTLRTGLLPIKEAVPIATVIFQTSDGYANAVKSRIRLTDTGSNYVDWRITTPTAGSSTVVDHGALTGLADDDHSQYHNDTRGDVRYFQKTEFLTTSAGATDTGKPIKLDADGNIDATMINDADIDHGSVGGLTDDDHTQYAKLLGRSGEVYRLGGTSSMYSNTSFETQKNDIVNGVIWSIFQQYDTINASNDQLFKLVIDGLDSSRRTGAKIQVEAINTWGVDLEDAPTAILFFCQSDGATDNLGDVQLGVKYGGISAGNDGYYYSKKSIDLPIWDMDSDASKTVAHGLNLATYRIRFVTGYIVNDTADGWTKMDVHNGVQISWDATNVTFTRISGGLFDNTSHNNTDTSRGKAVIEYELI